MLLEFHVFPLRNSPLFHVTLLQFPTIESISYRLKVHNNNKGLLFGQYSVYLLFATVHAKWGETNRAVFATEATCDSAYIAAYLHKTFFLLVNNNANKREPRHIFSVVQFVLPILWLSYSFQLLRNIHAWLISLIIFQGSLQKIRLFVGSYAEDFLRTDNCGKFPELLISGGTFVLQPNEPDFEANLMLLNLPKISVVIFATFNFSHFQQASVLKTPWKESKLDSLAMVARFTLCFNGRWRHLLMTSKQTSPGSSEVGFPDPICGTIRRVTKRPGVNLIHLQQPSCCGDSWALLTWSSWAYSTT